MIRRYLAVCFLGLAAITTASAHFAFLIPDGADKGKAVFSDTLKPDAQGVPVEKLAKTTLHVVVDGKTETLKWTHDKTGNCYTFDLPGTGTRLVYGTTDYGIFQRGESKPMWLKYYPKGIYGPLPTAEQATLGTKVPVEIVPIMEAGKVRFKVLANGKPVAKTEVTLLLPGESKASATTTDADGLTEAFAQTGMYGVVAKWLEDKAGEQDGKKYEEIRHYATLVVNISK